MKSKLIISLLVLCAFPLTSIVIRHDVPESKYFEIGQEFGQIVNMYDVGHGTGTLIADQWILTAAHVNDILTVGRTIRVKNSNYTIEKIINHPGFSTSSGVQNDIGLIKLDRAVTEVDVIPLYRCFNEVGKVIIFVGQGAEGNGQSGVVSFQSRDKKLRGATNIVEEANSQFLTFKFDPPSSPNATQYEGISGAGDSGGPAFIHTENGLKIMGVSSWQNSNGQSTAGGYNVIENYARVSSYTDWIDQTIINN